MSYKLLMAGTFPLLWLQGKWVRRTTPILPEPSGERERGSHQDAKLRILIAGDSAGAGVGVDTQDQALLGLLHKALEQQHPVYLELNAMTGLTSGEVLERMKSLNDPAFDVVIYSVGVNDVTGLTSEAKWRKHIRDLATVFQEQNTDTSILFSAIPPMHAFTALPQPLRTVMGQRAKRLDALLEEETTKISNCSRISAGFPVEGNMLAADGYHPGASAYQVWADTLVKHIVGNCLGE